MANSFGVSADWFEISLRDANRSEGLFASKASSRRGFVRFDGCSPRFGIGRMRLSRSSTWSARSDSNLYDLRTYSIFNDFASHRRLLLCKNHSSIESIVIERFGGFRIFIAIWRRFVVWSSRVFEELEKKRKKELFSLYCLYVIVRVQYQALIFIRRPLNF